MKTLVNRYDPCGAVNELTYVEIGDEVMYYTDTGYERVGTVEKIHDEFGSPSSSISVKREIVLLSIRHEHHPKDLHWGDLTVKAASDCYSENEMTEEQYEQALVHFKFSRRTSKIPMHVRTTLIDGSDAHFLEEDVIEYADSFSAVLRELLSARDWENSQL